MKTIILLMTLLIVSCGTTNYVHVDPVNYKRFKHDQKVRPGMTKEEIMEMFGSPDEVRHNWSVGQGVTDFVYYKKIFCSKMYCYMTFNNRDELMYSVNVRMEFDRTLVDVK